MQPSFSRAAPPEVGARLFDRLPDRYALTMALNLPLSLAGMFVLVDLAGLGVPLAAPAVTVMLAAFNFVGGRWALRAGRAQSRRQT